MRCTKYAPSSFYHHQLSYFWILDETADWDWTLNGIEVIAATLWLVCALIYISATIFQYYCSAENAGNSSLADESKDSPDADMENGQTQSPGEENDMSESQPQITESKPNSNDEGMEVELAGSTSNSKPSAEHHA